MVKIKSGTSIPRSNGNPSGVGLSNGHHTGCDSRGVSAARRRHSTGVYTRSAETVALRQASYGVHPMPAVDDDSRGLVSLGFGCSTAIVTTLKPVDVASAAVYVKASGSLDEVDVPLGCVEETDHNTVKPASPSPCKRRTSCSGNQESDVIVERESERRESDAPSSVSSSTNEDQRAGGILTQWGTTRSDASTFKASGTPQKAFLPPVNPSVDLSATEENGTTLPVPRGISRVDSCAISGAADESLEETDYYRSSGLDVGETIAIEPIHEHGPSLETASHVDADGSKGKTAGMLGEQSSVGGLCDTGGGPTVVAARCSPGEDTKATIELPILRRSTRRRSMRLVTNSQQNISLHDNAGVSATEKEPAWKSTCFPSASPSGAALRTKPSGCRSTRRRSLGAVSRGDNMGLQRRSGGAHCPETDASERQGVTEVTKKAIRCTMGKHQLVRREHTSVQGAVTLMDNAPAVSPWSSRTRSARVEKSTDDASSSLRTNRLGDLSGKSAKNKRTATLGPECPMKGRQIGAFSEVVKECMSKMNKAGVEACIGQERELQPLASLLAAVEAAEACCIEHEELSARIGTGETSHTTAGRKRVHFCSFDLSSVDMPRDTADGSEIPAKKIARCLARVTDAQSVVRDALQANGSHNNGFVEKWKAFLRELRVLAIHSVPGESLEQSKIGLGVAARFLLAELEPLETMKGPVYTALRGKLGNVLASLVRFNLRILLNPPPEKLSKSDDDVSNRRRFPGRSARLAGPTHFSKVHEMVELGRGQPNAAFTRALRRLYGYPGERAVEFVAEVERFLAEEASRGKEKLGLETRVEKVRRRVVILADIVDAVRARRFMRSLLNSDGVREAIAAAGGWVDVEKLASDLKRLDGPADIHTPFTLLSDIGGFERWLDDESLWPVKAERVLEKLLAFLAPITERPKRRRLENDESVELLRQDVQEVKQRAQLPAVKAVKHKISNSLGKAEQDRGNDADCRRPSRNKTAGANKKTRTVEGGIIAGKVIKVIGGDSGSGLSRSKSAKRGTAETACFSPFRSKRLLPLQCTVEHKRQQLPSDSHGMGKLNIL